MSQLLVLVAGVPSPEFVEYESARHFDAQLHEPLSKDGRRPTFITHPPARVEVHDGDPLTLKCSVSGYPKPKGYE